jgi:tetratricopeptide (TPR) repeat protein
MSRKNTHLKPKPENAAWWVSNSRKAFLLAVGMIVLAAWAAYQNSFRAPFIFDDTRAILSNGTIQHFSSALVPPSHSTVNGRPILNLSLAVNYAWGGIHVWGYHLVNLAIHILAGLTLWGIIRRTLGQPVLREKFGAAALPLATVAALLWVLHPLQTESVTYVIQRAESLAGLFYLLTLYCFIRGAESRLQESGVRNQEKEFKTQNPQATLPLSSGLTPDASRLWQAASILACLLGMATKEVLVSAPLIVWIYDRAFVAGSFRKAWQQRRGFYAGLAATWLLLAYLMLSAGNRSGSAGFGLKISWWAYALTQSWAIVHYLWLSVWPSPLVLDYGPALVKDLATIVPCLLLLTALLVAGGYAMCRKPMLGFIAAWFFLILAPTSSVVPIVTQTVAEHRMYLPLAAITTLVAMGLYAWFGRLALGLGLAVALGLGWLTFQRNSVYSSAVSIWSDAATKRPDNAEAHENLGIAFGDDDRMTEAVAQFEQAVQMEPDEAAIHLNFGIALAKIGRLTEAVAQDEEALRLRPNFVDGQTNLGVALAGLGRFPEALEHCQTAVQLEPKNAELHYNLGNVFFAMDRFDESISQYEEALRLKPDFAEAHNNLGIAFFRTERQPEAFAQFQEGVRLQPNNAVAQLYLANGLFQMGRPAEAISHYQEALRLKPDDPAAHYMLGNAFAQTSQFPLAVEQYQETLRLKPDFPEAHNNLGMTFAQMGQTEEAVEQYQEALQLRPDYPQARDNLARAQGQP